MTAKYGRRNIPKMYEQINALRRAIAAEGTPAIQDAWGAVEEHVDYAYSDAPAIAMRAAIMQHLTGLLGDTTCSRTDRAKWFDDGIATCIAEIEDLPIPG